MDAKGGAKIALSPQSCQGFSTALSSTVPSLLVSCFAQAGNMLTPDKALNVYSLQAIVSNCQRLWLVCFHYLADTNAKPFFRR